MLWLYNFSLRRNFPTSFQMNLYLGGKPCYFPLSFLSVSVISRVKTHYAIQCRFPYLLPCLVISAFALVAFIISFWLPVCFFSWLCFFCFMHTLSPSLSSFGNSNSTYVYLLLIIWVCNYESRIHFLMLVLQIFYGEMLAPNTEWISYENIQSKNIFALLSFQVKKGTRNIFFVSAVPKMNICSKILP